MPRSAPETRFDDLIRAGTEVFIAQGYRLTRMADVARAMGVATGTPYLYVAGKEALLDLALRHADDPGPIKAPAELPVPAPAPGSTVAALATRLERESRFPTLRAALERRRVTDLAGELTGILRELYDVQRRNRVVLKLADRCANDRPELHALLYGQGRLGVATLLEEYLRSGARKRRLHGYEDVSVAARIVLETITFWAVHRHWDPAPQVVDEPSAESTAVSFLVAALAKEVRS